jgi:hypothetical protein
MMPISTGPAAQLAFDVRHALRRFARTPTFALTAVAVLSLGIAANVTVFSMANAVLLQPLTFLEPERVVLFQTASPARAVNTGSPVMFWHWQKQTEVIQDVAAFHPAVVNDTSDSKPVQLRATRVSADYFRLFGAAPARGRTFTAADDRPAGDLVVVIAHRLWTTRYGAADVIGKAMRLDGEAYTTLIGNTRTVFFVLLAAVAFVLLIACSNLAAPRPRRDCAGALDPRSTCQSRRSRFGAQVRVAVVTTRVSEDT